MSYAAALDSAVRRRLGAAFLAAAFVLVAFPVVLFSALIVPGAEVPDEVAHIVRADSLLHGELIGRRFPVSQAGGGEFVTSGVLANPGLLAAGFAFAPGMPKVLTRERLDQLRAVPWAPASALIATPNTAIYTPTFYVPAALGLAAARVAGLSPYSAILAARMAQGSVFVLIGALALLFARRARELLFATLSVPMTLSLAGSCNQDGLLIATACLAVALLTSTRLGAARAGAAALALVLAAKPLYLPLALLVPLARPVRGWALGTRATWFVLTALPAVLWYLLAAKYAVVGFGRGAYTAGPLWPGQPGQAFATTDPAAQLRVFLHDPTLLFRLPVATIAQSDWLFYELVGVIGTLDLFLPIWLYGPWFVALAAALAASMVGSRSTTPGWPAPHCALGVLAVIATVFAVYDGQYLTWTRVGATLIEGPTGRYLLPILPFLGLSLPRLRLRGGDALRAVLTSPAVLAAASGLIVIPVLLVRAYYLR